MKKSSQRHIKNISWRKFNFDLKIYKEDYFDITVPFVKRTDVLINGSKCYDTTTQKEETIEF